MTDPIQCALSLGPFFAFTLGVMLASGLFGGVMGYWLARIIGDRPWT